MNIRDVKTAIKVGDFVLKKNHRNHIDIKYLPTLATKYSLITPRGFI